MQEKHESQSTQYQTPAGSTTKASIKNFFGSIDVGVTDGKNELGHEMTTLTLTGLNKDKKQKGEVSISASGETKPERFQKIKEFGRKMFGGLDKITDSGLVSGILKAVAVGTGNQGVNTAADIAKSVEAINRERKRTGQVPVNVSRSNEGKVTISAVDKNGQGPKVSFNGMSAKEMEAASKQMGAEVDKAVDAELQKEPDEIKKDYSNVKEAVFTDIEKDFDAGAPESKTDDLALDPAPGEEYEGSGTAYSFEDMENRDPDAFSSLDDIETPSYDSYDSYEEPASFDSPSMDDPGLE